MEENSSVWKPEEKQKAPSRGGNMPPESREQSENKSSEGSFWEGISFLFFFPFSTVCGSSGGIMERKWRWESNFCHFKFCTVVRLRLWFFFPFASFRTQLCGYLRGHEALFLCAEFVQPLRWFSSFLITLNFQRQRRLCHLINNHEWESEREVVVVVRHSR